MARHIAIILRDSQYFVSHREDLAKMLCAAGNRVSVLCSKANEPSWQRIIAIGCSPREVPFIAASKSPLASLQCVFRTAQFLCFERPNFVFSITVLSTLISGLLCRALLLKHVALMAGLGTLFRTDRARFRFLSPVINTLFRLSLRKDRTTVIFQNSADLEFLVSRGICDRSDTIVIPGSGIDLSKFYFKPANTQKSRVKVGMVSRMLRDKGVAEFLAAARELSEKYTSLDFVLIGGVDLANPTSYSEAELTDAALRSNVRWLGHRDDIPRCLADIDIFCLPSYHEGFSKAVLEAAASGCAIVVSDIPGCTAIVQDGVSGVVVPKADAKALARGIEELVDNPAQARKLSIRAHERVELEFENNKILETYAALLS